MKNYIFFLILFCVSILNAQQAPEIPKYNAKNSANIFYYNFSEVPEKIKVKKDAIQNKTLKALRNYNFKIKNLSFLNTPKLTELEIKINTLGKELYTNRDLAEGVQKQVRTLILPLRDSVAAYEKILNSSLESFLSKKQFKKWLKYQKAEKRKLLPEKPKNNNSTQPPRGLSNRRGGGLGGRRF